MKQFHAAVCVVAALSVAGCSSPSAPTQPSATVEANEADLTASVTWPRALQPANNVQIKHLDQPVTLVVQNALKTRPGATTYTFEVSTDAGFATKVQTKDGVAEGSNGQTSLKLDALAPERDYYWHARATGGGTTGVFGPTFKFTIGPQIIIGTATLVSPIANAGTAARPALVVTNATRTGPVGALIYKFEIATNAGFSPVLITASLSEGVTRTTYQPTADLPAETTIFWRVTVTDSASNITGAATSAGTFATTFAIDLKRVIYLNSPDVSNWPETANLVLVEQDGGGDGPVCMQYTDPGWPDSHWPYGGPDPNFGVYANQWYFAKIAGQWYGGAGEWIYRGAASCKAGQGTTTIGPDAGFGEPFRSWVPRVGELVGFMVSSVARAGAVQRTVDERSNVIVQPWRDTSLGSRTLAIFGRR